MTDRTTVNLLDLYYQQEMLTDLFNHKAQGLKLNAKITNSTEI